MIKYKVGEDTYNIPKDQLEDFKLEFPEAEEIVKEVKENGVAETDASAAPEENTASILDPGSSVSTDSDPDPKKKRARYFIGGGSEFTEEGEIKLRGVSDGQFIPVGLEEVEVTAKQYNEKIQQEQNDAARNIMMAAANLPELTEEDIKKQKQAQGELTSITPFEESQRISKFEKEARDRRQKKMQDVSDGKIDLSFLEDMYGTLTNSMRQLSGIDDQFSYMYHFMGTQNFDLTANIYGVEAADKLYKESIEGMGRAKSRIDRLQNQNLPTQAFYNLNKDNYFSGGIAAALDGIASVGTSIASTPAGLFTTIASDRIKEYNETKAREEGINTEVLINSGKAETIVPLFLSFIEYASEKGRINQVGKYIKSLPTSAKKEMFSLFNVFGSNFGQEIFQYGIGELNVNLAKGMSLDKAGLAATNAMFSKNGLEQGFKGGFGGFGFSLGGKVLTASHAIRSSEEQQKIKNSIKQLNDLENSKFKKNISEDQIKIINTTQAQIKQDLKNQFDSNDNIVSSLNEKQLNIISKNSDFLTESGNEINKIKSSTELDSDTKNILINNIEKARNNASQEIYEIRSEGEKLVNNITKAKQASKFISGVKIKDFANKKEIDDYLKDNKDLNIKSSNDQGFIVQDPNTEKQTIFINRETASKETVFHEMGHAILYKTVKDNPETAINLGNELLKELDKIDAVQIKDSNFKKRMEQYSDKSKEVQMEEALTLFSDALASGDIKFQENVFTRIGDSVRRVLQRLGVNIKFNTGRDVYNFIKDYNNSIKDGKLNLSQVKAAAKGVEGELIAPKQQEQEIKTTTKESKTIVEENKRLSEQLKNATTQEAVDIKNDLALNNEGIVNEFVNSKFKTGLGITKEEFKSGAQEEVLVYLNRTYDPSKGEYGAYLREGLFGGGKFGGGRLGNILKRLGQEGDLFTKEIDDRTTPEVLDTTTEETTERIAEKPTKAKESLRKKIKLDKATTQKVVDAVTKTFGTKLPPVDSPQFKKALQKGFRTELKTIMAKDVLGSRAAYETFLRDNFENIYEAIPQDVINKRFRQFAEDTGKREKTKEGKKIFKKKNIAKAEFIKYFLGRDVGTSTKGTRKDALAEALAEEFAFDATMETIQKPEIIEKREFVDKAQTTEKVSKAIKRPVDLKFSKSINKTNSEINLENKLQQDLNEGKSIKSLYKTVDDSNIKQKQEYYNVLSKLENLLDAGKTEIEKIDSEDFKELAENLGVSIVELKQETEKQFKDWKNLIPKISKDFNLDIKYYAEKSLTNEQNLENTINNLKSVIDFFPNITLLQKEAPQLLSALKGTVGVGKSIEINGKRISADLYRDLSKNKGRGKVKPWMKTVYQPASWGYGKYGFKTKAENKLKELKNKYVGWEIDYAFYLANELTHPSLRSLNTRENLKGYIKTSDANREAIKFLYNNLANKFFKSNNKEQALEDIVNILKLQTNHANGILKGLVPVTSATTNPAGPKDKKTHNEHMVELFNSNRRFLEILAKYKNPTSKEAKFEIDFLVNQLQQALTSEANKLVKDSKEKGGAATQVSTNPYANTFLLENAANEQIMLIDSPGITVSDYIFRKYSPTIFRTLTKTKQNNIAKLPKNIQIKFSKSTSNKEVLNEMQRLDTEAQNARIKFSKSKDLSSDFNDIIEKATGIGKEKEYGQTKARAVGADKGKWDWAGIPPSAQDFVGLTRYFAGKGKEGDKTIAWVKENFLDPFARANIDISNARVALANDFKALKKLLNVSPKDLNKKIPGEPYTIGNAIRVYTWGQQGMKVPGLSKADQKILEDLIAADENLQLFANELIAINKDNGYPKPQDSWLAGTITTDLLSGLNTVVRAKYLKQWQNNVNEVFTEANMNKLEAAFGSGYRDSLENMLGRMKTGSNRGFKGDTLTGRFTDWINGSVGAIMFFNMRSAVLQTISAVNFVNLSDNNMFKAAAAFANQPQYWKDVIQLMNSDYLVERRNGLKINVNEADIAEIAAESKNKAKAFINKLLKLGFLPTQIADSFAIASGGATFYRNRLKSLIKDGMSQKEAEAQAFQDFREIAEESQQSSRPDRISAQQAGPMGRIILAFANTPAQYARLMQKAASDLKNRRGDDKTNISKIIYYGAVQNVIFNALQQALFAMAFGDEEPDEEKKNKKYTGIVNGMADSLLRGIGFHGAAISTLKNVIMKLADGAKAQDAAIEMLDISPPVSSKIGKLRSAGRTWDWNKKEIMEKGWSLDNPAYLAAGQVVSAATNVPLDRGIRKLQNLKDASDAENEEWMRVANALGWAKWELEWQKNKPKKNRRKSTSKSTGKSTSKSTRK